MSERTDAPPAGVDPRALRFAAGITSLLLLIDVFLGLTGLSTAQGTVTFIKNGAVVDPTAWAIAYASVAERILDPAFLLLLVIALLFLWTILSARTSPWSVLFRTVVRPRLKAPADLEDPRPPRFAQGVGLLVTTIGLLLQLFGVPWALPIAAAVAFVAAFLNAAFGLCLGCQLYLLLQRAGIVGRERPSAA
ncbi:hypothetical protein ASD65_18345 [Microbacterium sp. Root61]|uniref:DUF4395 domain-containing protein n=1 Tax=Microbacterium sp. Root61 TaxID=1736570 RepID=UPI0006F95C2F|nr:DUF4395 domain-containing protein [Microbacterium sp. Root61]KRA22431.1 hypothetical protein ASD65_18345 [Microbacterium sp. Root61]